MFTKCNASLFNYIQFIQQFLSRQLTFSCSLSLFIGDLPYEAHVQTHSGGASGQPPLSTENRISQYPHTCISHLSFALLFSLPPHLILCARLLFCLGKKKEDRKKQTVLQSAKGHCVCHTLCFIQLFSENQRSGSTGCILNTRCLLLIRLGHQSNMHSENRTTKHFPLVCSHIMLLKVYQEASKDKL